jgi:Cytosine/adenosine deaminases
MYTTLSPCDMCTGACILYKVKRVVIGENKNFLGGEELLLNKGKEVVVLDNAECKELMTNFIKEKPELWYVVFDAWPIAMRKAALVLLAVASRIVGCFIIINTNCSVCYTGTRISLSNFTRPAYIIALNTPRIENIHNQKVCF